MRIPEGPTNWSLYDVPTIAAMLDEHYDEAWDQVMAWRYAYDTISEHRAQLSRARTELAAGWPPEQSIASERYFETIDGLDRSLADTSDAAIRNSNALADVLTALSQAKASIDWLHRSWKTNAIAPAMSSHGGVPVETSINAVLMVDLNAQAHEIMTKTDQTIFENTRQLTTPTPFQLKGYGGDFSPVTTSCKGGKTTQSQAPTRTSPANNGLPTSATPEPITISTGQQDHNSGSTRHTGTGSTRISELAGSAAGGLAGLISLSAKDPRLVSAKETVPSPEAPASKTISEAMTSTHAAKVSPQVTTETQLGSQSEASGMLAPNTSVPSQSTPPRRRRRRPETAGLKMPKGVPSLIVPCPDEPIYHDPGPGVIGLTR